MKYEKPTIEPLCGYREVDETPSSVVAGFAFAIAAALVWHVGAVWNWAAAVVAETAISDISKPQNILFLLSFITDTYNDMALSPVLKMRAIIDETKKTSEIKELLETAGFTNEAKLKNELGENHDVSYYSIVL